MKSVIDWIAWVLIIVGALNWGLVGVLEYNLVESLSGTGTFARVVYTLVGVSALWAIFMKFKK